MLIMEILIWTGVLGFRGLWQKVQGQGDCFLCLNLIIDNNTVACKCTFLNSLAKQQPIKENNSVVDESIRGLRAQGTTDEFAIPTLTAVHVYVQSERICALTRSTKHALTATSYRRSKI